jgi:hypothetical protein
MGTCPEGTKVRIVVLVGDWRIEGDLPVGESCRVTDALNAHVNEFIALTDAKVSDARTGELLVESAFVDVNRLGISMVWAIG